MNLDYLAIHPNNVVNTNSRHVLLFSLGSMQTRLTLFVRNTCEHSGNNYVLVNLLCDLLEIVTLVSFSRVSLVSTCFVPRSKTARMYPFINTQNKLYSLILFFQTCGSCSYSLFPQCHIRTIGNGCIHVKRPRN